MVQEGVEIRGYNMMTVGWISFVYLNINVFKSIRESLQYLQQVLFAVSIV